MIEYLANAFASLDIDFVVQLIIAEILFVWKSERRKYFVLRCLLSVAVCIFASILWINTDITTVPGFVLAIFRYLFLFVLTIFALPLCFRIPLSESLFYCVGAYAAQHCAFSLKMLVMVVVRYASGGGFLFFADPVDLAVDVAVFAAVYVPVYFVFVRRIRGDDLGINRLKLLIPSMLLVFTSVVINLNWYRTGQFDAVNELYPIVCCIMALFVLAGLFENGRLQMENGIIKYMLKMKKDYGDLAKENINIINAKCHDMKHQLAALLRSHTDLGSYADEITESINVYDSIAKTGNEALDVILTEKSLQCEGNGIRFTYMADGSLLDFMSATDIYSLFGNALDNAIESVKKLTNAEKRIINMTFAAHGGLLTVHFENYYEGSLSFEGGLPLTTKSDTAYHGFGMKSIAMIAEKYGGTVSVVAERGIFGLNVILPFPKSFGAAEATSRD